MLSLAHLQTPSISEDQIETNGQGEDHKKRVRSAIDGVGRTVHRITDFRLNRINLYPVWIIERAEASARPTTIRKNDIQNL